MDIESTPPSWGFQTSNRICIRGTSQFFEGLNPLLFYASGSNGLRQIEIARSFWGNEHIYMFDWEGVSGWENNVVDLFELPLYLLRCAHTSFPHPYSFVVSVIQTDETLDDVKDDFLFLPIPEEWYTRFYENPCLGIDLPDLTADDPFGRPLDDDDDWADNGDNPWSPKFWY